MKVCGQQERSLQKEVAVAWDPVRDNSPTTARRGNWIGAGAKNGHSKPKHAQIEVARLAKHKLKVSPSPILPTPAIYSPPN